MAETVDVMVGKSSRGAPVFEEVLVERCGDRRYRLLRSPGLALGLAADDVFDLRADGSFQVIKRGGNICIQIFSTTALAEAEVEATARLVGLGGRLDGRAEKELVYTIAASVGFEPIEAALREVEERVPESEWVYGNVYDPVDGVTPLNWWTA